MSDYSYSGSPAAVSAAVQALSISGVRDFCPAMQFDDAGNLVSPPPQDANGNAYIRVRGNNLATPTGLAAIDAATAIPYCGVWLGENP